MTDLTHITCSTGHVSTVRRGRFPKGMGQAVAHAVAEGGGVYPGGFPLRMSLRQSLSGARIFSLSEDGTGAPLVIAAVCWAASEEAWQALEDSYVEAVGQPAPFRALCAPATTPWLAVHLTPAFYRRALPLEASAFIADAEQWTAWGILDAARGQASARAC